MQENNKNILIVGPYPPPFGGISNHIANFIPDLFKQGFNVFIISYTSKNELLKYKNATILKINLKTRICGLLKLNNIYRNIKCFCMLRKYRLSMRDVVRELVRIDIISNLVNYEKIQLISFYSIVNGYSIPIFKKLFKAKIPLVLTIYATIYENFYFYSTHLLLTKTMLDMSDKVIASSKYSAKSVELLGLDSSIIEPVYYGVDLLKFMPEVNKYKIKKEIGIQENRKILLFVGRMLEEMGLDVILNIIPIILKERGDVVFIIVGPKGELTPNAYALQEKYENRAFVRTDISFDNLPYYYAACDILLAPTRGKHASMGMSIKEAMASGRAVIATDAPGIREAVIHGVTGVLITADGDSNICRNSLCEEILRLLDKPEEVELLGNNARKRAEELFDKNFTSKKMVSIFESLLEKYK